MRSWHGSERTSIIALALTLTLPWRRQDLKAAQANRKAVPWIVAMSHFPLYCSNCPKPGTEPGDWWNAEATARK